MLTKEEISKLKAALPRGGMAELVKITGHCQSYISMVFSGERESEEVIKAALNLIENKKKAYSSLSKKIKSL